VAISPSSWKPPKGDGEDQIFDLLKSRPEDLVVWRSPTVWASRIDILTYPDFHVATGGRVGSIHVDGASQAVRG
jgi:hypothetical protein